MKRLVALAVLACTAVLAPAVVSTQSAGTAPAVTGCVIRWNSAGPYIYENSAHDCTGATSLSINANGSLVIEQTPGHSKVISVTVEEDETLSGVVQAGPSGGVTETVVKFWDLNGNVVRADSAKLRSLPYGNIWVTWVNEDAA